MPSLVPFLVIMVLTQAMLGAAYSALSVLAPVAAPEMGLTVAALGPYSAVLAAAALSGGMLIDGMMRRYGAARIFQVAVATTAAGLLAGASGTVVGALLSAALVGFAGGMTMPCALHLIARATPPERGGIVMAINQCGMPAGFGLAGVLLPLMLNGMNWQMTLVLLAVAHVLVIPAMQTMRPALDSDRDPAAPLGGKAFVEPLRMAWTLPKLRLLGWLAFSFMCVQWTFVTYLVSYVNIELEFSHVAAGSALFVSQLTSIVSRLFFGWLLDRVGRHFLVLGMLGTGSGVLALTLGMATPQWSYGAVLALSAACGAFLMGWNAVYFAAVRRFAPEGRAGTAVGGTQVFTMMGTAVGPMLFAAILGAAKHYATGFVVLSIFALVMGVRVLWLDRDMRAHGA